MALIIISIVLLIGLLVGISKYGHTFWRNTLQGKAYNGEKKLKEADDREYKAVFMLFGLFISLMLCFLTFELLFNHLIPDNSDNELIDKIEAELEEVPVIDLPPPPPPTEVFDPPIEEAEEEIEEPEIEVTDTIVEDPPPIVLVVPDVTDFEPDPEPVDNTIYGYGQIAKNATFPGGHTELVNFLRANMNYPAFEYDNKIGGKVHVTFVVEKDGRVTDARFVRKVDSESLNNEAMRLVKAMPKWEPGETKQGVLVRQRHIIPITFKVTD